MNLQQEKFCHEYLFDFNATQAAIRAGYSEKSAYSIGHELLKKPEILQNIRTISKDYFTEIGITKQRIIKEIALLAFAKEGSEKSKIKALEILLNHVNASSLATTSQANVFSNTSRVMEAIKKLKMQ